MDAADPRGREALPRWRGEGLTQHVMSDLLWSDTIAEDARLVHTAVELRLRELQIPGTLELTGAASLPGVLTKGDIDLHLRVAERAFAHVIDRLRTAYRPTNIKVWAATLAVFDIPGSRPAGLAVTPVGSEHDRRFTTAWRSLAEDKVLLEEYNDLKRTTFGDPCYEDRKSAFFSRITSV
jgi:GrpB protein